MRMSREAMARHHEDIVTTGARMLRERGIEGTSVADLMQAAGLTHGGFYRHFASKDAFVREATVAAFENVRVMRDAGTGTAVEQLAAWSDYYLSESHLKQPGSGCPIAALSSEVMRASPGTQEVFAEAVDEVIDWIAARLVGDETLRRRLAPQILALLVGAVVTARACGNGEVATRILASARRQIGAILGC